MASKIFELHTSKGQVYIGTIEELTKICSYTLECGKSYESEKGNKKINLHPKTFKTLVSNLNNAETNRAANGCASKYYW